MTEFHEGDRVAARPHVIAQDARLAGKTGTVHPSGKTRSGRQRLVVTWDLGPGEDPGDCRLVNSEVSPSGLRLVSRAAPAGPAPASSPLERDPGLPFPGVAGRYLVVFASRTELEADGTTQLDAARKASARRDVDLRAARRQAKVDEAPDAPPPHDRVVRTILLEARGEEEAGT